MIGIAAAATGADRGAALAIERRYAAHIGVQCLSPHDIRATFRPLPRAR